MVQVPRAFIVLVLMVGPVWAGPFKCVQPDGRVVYQDVQCDAGSAGAELRLDPSTPGGQDRGKAQDYSVQGQLKALEAERRKADKARKAQEKAAAATEPAGKKAGGYDRAKCAKNRAEAARWRQKVRNGYRDQDDREYQEQKLEYYESLADQFCRPD
jgi:hypothetical protein